MLQVGAFVLADAMVAVFGLMIVAIACSAIVFPLVGLSGGAAGFFTFLAALFLVL